MRFPPKKRKQQNIQEEQRPARKEIRRKTACKPKSENNVRYVEDHARHRAVSSDLFANFQHFSAFRRLNIPMQRPVNDIGNEQRRDEYQTVNIEPVHLSAQKNKRFDVADDYNSPQKCPFSDVETTKNLGYNSRQYLLGILYSILPPLSILSKTFILQWVKGENIHEKKGRPKDAFPLGRPCCFTSV